MPSKPWTINEFLVFFLRKWLNFWDEKSWPIFKELELVYHGRTNRIQMVQETDQWDIFYVIFALCVHAMNCMNFLPRFKLWVRLESRNKLKRLTRANIYLRVIAAISSYQNSLVVITWILAEIIKNELWALARGFSIFIHDLLGSLDSLERFWNCTRRDFVRPPRAFN